MNSKTLKTLEYDKILGKIQTFAVSACAKNAIEDLEPCEGKGEILRVLGEVKEAFKINTYGVSPTEDFDDCEEIISRSEKGMTLSPSELIKIRRLLRAGRIASDSLQPFEVPLIKEYSGSYFTDKNLENEIGRCIISENEVSDNASSALRDIRRKLADKKNSLRERLSGYFHKSEYSKFLQDNLVTIRNDRFVLPVKAEYRSSVPGLVHDISSSGATVFIEPFAVVETNNEIKSLTLSEAAEVEKILKDLTQRTADNANNLIKMQNALTELDIIFAKMKYSAHIDGTEPIFNERGNVKLISARHPLIGASVVPVSITVGGDYKILMITGPNTGGKTVCLKTVGLTCLMAYTGLFIPCEAGSEVAIFDDIFCDIGDDQSIAQSLSTFSSHIVNLVSITESMTRNTLLLLDELGGGTDPQEGAALAIGIIKYIESFCSTAVITTHYGQLKEYALVSKNILNASMQFDSRTFKPTYKLIPGVPGTSNALKIAASLGLNEKIIENAKESMDEEKIRLDELIKSAEDMKTASEEELFRTKQLNADIDAIRQDLADKQKELDDRLEKIKFNAKNEIKRMVLSGVEKADEIIEELKEKVAIANEKALFEANALRKRLENMVYEADEDEAGLYEKLDTTSMKIGDKVFVKSLNSVGTVVASADKKGEVTVALGAIRTKVKLDDLARPIVVEKQTKKKQTEYKPTVRDDAFVLTPEINVIGSTVSEAIGLLEPYIMNLSLSTKTLRIVHGKGTGALGRGIQAYLRTVSKVKSFRYGGYGEGDTGVTIVEFKENV